MRSFALECSGVAKGHVCNDAALKDFFNYALDEPLSWWSMTGLDHLSFGGFVDFLARQGKTHVRDTAASPEAAVDTAASPEVAVENAVSPELTKDAAVSPKAVDHTLLHSRKRRKRRKASISPSPVVLEFPSRLMVEVGLDLPDTAMKTVFEQPTFLVYPDVVEEAVLSLYVAAVMCVWAAYVSEVATSDPFSPEPPVLSVTTLEAIPESPVTPAMVQRAVITFYALMILCAWAAYTSQLLAVDLEAVPEPFSSLENPLLALRLFQNPLSYLSPSQSPVLV
ncbi:hypothetical protein IRJ41_012966 [Triplophysa rosa]|uniref:Uncharacterized protein n=1 Tax=Triplophysa rosa TaxID=992332 RepID=A0A9W7WC14_TRIRA|nr:hypothetical protein IRJ41_012966 [Triplophysa rosa]